MLRRLAAYVIDVALLALGVWLGTVTGLQLALLWVVYGLFALHLIVALRNRGRRSVHDLAAGAAVLPGHA